MTEIQWQYAGYQLIIQRFDPLSIPFVLVFTLTLIIGAIYSFQQRDVWEKSAALVYGGGAIGAVLAGDWLTFYVAWEIMAWSSLYLIWAPRNKASAQAGFRYLLVHLLGGSLLLAGIWIHIQQSGSLSISAMEQDNWASWLILLGMAVNAAIPPLHAWLPDAYPQATVTGSVFLSAFTTKTAVYALARTFPGWEVLIWAGIVMTLYGVIFAVMENNMRRLLSYHIVSQVGYMVAAIGLGTTLSISGATAHAFAHVLYKALLFMGVGTIVYAVGKEKLTELGGLDNRLRRSLLLYMVGAVSISGFPLFSGFVSKSLVISAFSGSNFPLLALVLQVASVGTFLSTGLKLPYYAWFQGEASYREIREVPKPMYFAMTIAGGLSLLIGLFPQVFYRLLPYAVNYRPYSAAHLSETVQILLFTIVGFMLVLDRTSPKSLLTLDSDWIYRRLAPRLWHQIITPIASFMARLDEAVEKAIQLLVAFSENPRAFSRWTDLQKSLAVVLAAFALLAIWMITSGLS